MRPEAESITIAIGTAGTEDFFSDGALGFVKPNPLSEAYALPSELSLPVRVKSAILCDAALDRCPDSDFHSRPKIIFMILCRQHPLLSDLFL